MQGRLGNQSGMASFLIVMIMMVVITLIVLGFSQVARRNAREALDRQLGAQAFYAAESGVNVTTSSVASYVKTNGFTNLPTKTSCSGAYDPTDSAGVGAAVANLGGGVRYSCVLVNPNPSTLKYNPTRTSSTVIPIQANGNIRTLTFTWNVQSGTDYTCTGASPQVFPAAAAWTCDFGIVRLDLTEKPASNVADLPGHTVSLYLTPLGAHSGAITIPNLNTATKAYVASASGCAGGTCSVTVTLLPNTDNYYARVTSLYRDTPNMIVSGTLASGAPATFSGAQVVVDTTGQAQDQLRRIQVRVELSATADPETIPTNALSSSTDICKRFSIMPSGSVNPAALCL
jgi:Tfp pilus assembly protein PilV